MVQSSLGRDISRLLVWMRSIKRGANRTHPLKAGMMTVKGRDEMHGSDSIDGSDVSRSYKSFVWVAILAVLLIAFFLRVHELGDQSLWHDEGNSVVQAARSFPDIAANAARDIHPPAYYWLLAIWRVLTGESEFALRALSMFASVMTVAFAYGIGARLYGRWAGVLAAGFVALNTFSIYYAQEARMYALLAMASAGAVWSLILLMRRPTRTHAVMLAGFNALGLWTQYAFPFVMVGQGIAALVWWITEIKQPNRIKRIGWYVAANVGAIVLFLPWLPTAWERVTTWPNTGDPLPMAESINVILNWFAFGITARDQSISVVILLLLFGLMVWQSPRGGRIGGKRFPAWMLVPIALAVVPTGIFLAAGLFREANLKFLLPAQIGFAVWMARGVWVLATLSPRSTPARNALLKWIAPLAGAAAALWMIVNLWAGVPLLYDDPAYQRDDYRAIAARIAAEAPPNSAIILNAPNQEEVFRYYYRGDLPIYPLPVGLGGDDAAAREAVESVIAEYERVYAVFWGETERDPNRVVETSLDTLGYEIDNTWYGDVRLTRYAAGYEYQAFQRGCSGTFGEIIDLTSCLLNWEWISQGEILRVSLNWRARTRITTRYKVFLQLLNPDGTLALGNTPNPVQRDSEPRGGSFPTNTLQADRSYGDNHALIIPPELPDGTYTLIVGLYSTEPPYERLTLPNGDTYVTIAEIHVPYVPPMDR